MKGSLKTIRILCLAMSLSVFVSCNNNGSADGTIESLVLDSALLGKAMGLSVYLPAGYSSDVSYPILYFIPYGGGGPVVITNMILNDSKSTEILKSDDCDPFIVVGVRHDGSFLLDSDPPHGTITGSSGLTFSKGYYESYFIQEVIPYIEGKYQNNGSKVKRYIGGYSMGGYAALHIALAYPDLFSKVGAHSPTLFIDSLPDKIATQLMYPDSQTRMERDPLMMELDNASLLPVQFLIDTGAYDINRKACEVMYERLKDAGLQVTLKILPGSHGVPYLSSHMPEYLAFYGH